MSRKFLTLALALGVSPGPAQAQADTTPFSTGNTFIRRCDSAAWSLSCSAYVLGLYHGTPTGPGARVCLPPGVDTGQLLATGKAFITKHPEISHYSASSLIIGSWIEAFPCKK